jgi:hypothetical protein
MFCSFALEYVKSKVQKNKKGIELNGAHHPVVYPFDVVEFILHNCPRLYTV